MDGGDFFHRSSKDKLPETAIQWREMGRINYDAIALGELEFGQWVIAESLMAICPLPIVCTNVERLVNDEWKPIGEPYRIVEKNGIRIGVVSVIDKVQLSDVVVKKSGHIVRLLDPMESVTATIEEIESKTDMIVLLAHLDSKAMEAFGSSIEGIDVVLGGHMAKKDEGPLLVANAVVNRAGTRGMHLASTRLIISPDDRIVDFGGKNITLTADIPEDPVVADLALTAKTRTDELRRARNADRREAAKRKANEKLVTTPEVKKLLSPKRPTEDTAPE